MGVIVDYRASAEIGVDGEGNMGNRKSSNANDSFFIDNVHVCRWAARTSHPD
jgi:hypothetical protein